ncbi:amino acid aminotransferase [Agrobacterium vitis]|uniref:amino acid aminotransferase n=1 Tax=Agrobacterium vitis TaxID=373 RepID=UPI0009BD980A|nr:amino acid aminotransferase [Agrobacterium vitis]MCE6076893.1 aminotransferase class I/II-fold pyridoxal phosphate-dependent enzyme [Agrobacterium vitis]MCF1455497.1 aspartate/tyrosine/aromatic aminotransferase [Agrobacterium vitis]MUO71277.1 aminotransferase class I/II-fold pyridoxal phosphate-dependent enzyme [Agrobacterium vitis]MUO84259.1 aminotransferase class I/II-fold pyridoxal phosphate-dependent enzyme [Agrobacterium vitis]BCH57182.1 aminotransferase [Agrobacterium vitis]
MLDTLTMPPPDKILALMPIFRQDSRSHKLDLGVGVYRDASGITPVLRAVREAEARILRDQTTKAYIGPAGDAVYCDLMTKLVFGDHAPCERIRAIQTPGGAGALAVICGLIAKSAPNATLLVPDPTWVNHLSIIEDNGLAVKRWPYLDPTTGGVDFEALKQVVCSAKAGDVMLLHGCCHNPTGTDLNQAQWRELGMLLIDKGVVPFIDIAYQGFGDGLDEDAFGVRYLATTVPEMLVASSCSKNFGIYRERTGVAFVMGQTSKQAEIAAAQMVVRARIAYSMPPDHGSRIVSTILGDADMSADWRAELEDMRNTIVSLRQALAKAFQLRSQGNHYDFLTANKGMFSKLGVTPQQVERLRNEFAIYMVEDSRINIAGLRHEQIDSFVEAVVCVTR